jgi:hypothetical protein
MNKKPMLITSVFLIVFVTLVIFLDGKRRESNTLYTGVTITPTASRIMSGADWVSNAVTANELVLESDIIVRVRVTKAPVARILTHKLPVWDENNNIVGSTLSEILFSDTAFEIIKTYLGNPPLNITVMQTGGYNQKLNRIEEVMDDPLYKVGEEYVLFLVDISGDHVHAPDRELYRTVNPSGRYGINGESVFSYGENLQSVQLPTMLSDLESQIEQSVQKAGK